MTPSLLILILGSWTVLSILRKDIALAMLILLLPVYQVRLSFYSIPTTLLELFILILVLAFALSYAMGRKRLRIPHVWVIGSICVAAVLATIFSADVHAGLGLLKAYIIEPILIYIVFVHTIHSPEQKRRIEWALIGLTMYVSVVALLQWSGFMSIPEPYASEVPARATSVFPFPTAIGKLLGPLIAWCMTFLFFIKSAYTHTIRYRLIAYSIVTVLGVWALIVSRNRGALVGVALAAFVALMFAWRRRIIIPVVIILFVVAFTTIPVLRSEITQVASRQDTSTDVRIVMWEGTIRLIQANPIFGAGLGGFPVLYDEYRDASHVELFPNPDNLYLTLWAELGILGVVVFIWLFWVWISETVYHLREQTSRSSRWLVGLASLLFLVSLLGHGLLDTPYFKNDLAVLFWIVFGYFVIYRQEQKSSLS